MSLRKKIAFYLEDVESLPGIAINLTILGLILLSLVIFVAETYPLPVSVQTWLNALDFSILIIFSLEYIVRFCCADNKVKFFFSVSSLIDLLAIVPLLFDFLDIRFVRIFRWFRILRILRFFKFNVSIFRVKTEDGIILLRIFLTLFSIIFVYSGLIYQVEKQVNDKAIKNFFDAFYFCVVTMTTVGYGDVTPISEGGRVMTLLMILTGVLLIPWQLSELVKQVVKSGDRVEKICSVCSLSLHDSDAMFCKKCGNKLN